MLGIFGSVARNEQTEDSDIDIVYEGEANILLRSRIRTELENLLGCKVDLIRFRKQTENTPFGQAILKDSFSYEHRTTNMSDVGAHRGIKSLLKELKKLKELEKLEKLEELEKLENNPRKSAVKK